MMFLHIVLVMKLTPRPTGFLFISSSFGGSVANAKAPSVSIIILTQSNCTAVRGAVPDIAWQSAKKLSKDQIKWPLLKKLGKYTTKYKFNFMEPHTYNACRSKIDHQSNNIYCQLELHKFLNVYINWASPFGNIDNGTKIIIHYDDICTLLRYLDFNSKMDEWKKQCSKSILSSKVPKI